LLRATTNQKCCDLLNRYDVAPIAVSLFQPRLQRDTVTANVSTDEKVLANRNCGLSSQADAAHLSSTRQLSRLGPSETTKAKLPVFAILAHRCCLARGISTCAASLLITLLHPLRDSGLNPQSSLILFNIPLIHHLLILCLASIAHHGFPSAP
jgi:hypothetical protein